MSDCSKDWCQKVRRCPEAAEGFEPYHKWISISKTVTAQAQQVTGLMCGICFQEVIVSEAHKHRDEMSNYDFINL